MRPNKTQPRKRQHAAGSAFLTDHMEDTIVFNMEQQRRSLPPPTPPPQIFYQNMLRVGSYGSWPPKHPASNREDLKRRTKQDKLVHSSKSTKKSPHRACRSRRGRRRGRRGRGGTTPSPGWRATKPAPSCSRPPSAPCSERGEKSREKRNRCEKGKICETVKKHAHQVESSRTEHFFLSQSRKEKERRQTLEPRPPNHEHTCLSGGPECLRQGGVT